MKTNFAWMLSLGAVLALPAATAQSLPTIASESGQLPEIICSATSCWAVSERVRLGTGPAPQVANPIPVVIAPPAGQRLLWQGAGYPACQTIIGTSSGNPYEYIKAESIDVPLGTTHVSLSVTLEAKFKGGPAGAGGSFGMLQVRPEGGTWQNASFGYAGTILGDVNTTNQYEQASYIGLVDLAALIGAAGVVPSRIDVRMALFENKALGFTAQENSVCKGLLELSF